jgi:hypothetical protein
MAEVATAVLEGSVRLHAIATSASSAQQLGRDRECSDGARILTVEPA